MPARPDITVYIHGGQFMKKLEHVRAYELLDLKAAVYHKFVFDNDVVLYVNDFGVRSIAVDPSGRAAQFEVPQL